MPKLKWDFIRSNAFDDERGIDRGFHEAIHQRNKHAIATLDANEGPRIEYDTSRRLHAAPHRAPRLVKRLNMLLASVTSLREGFTSR